MKTKKSEKANLENKRSLFFQIGIVLVLAAILAAFEWSTKLGNLYIFEPKEGDETIEFTPPITRTEPEKKNIVKPAFVIEPMIVPDKTIIIDEPEILSSEDFPDNKVPIFEPTPDSVDDPIYYKVEIYPKFMGKNDKAFRDYILENIKFPEDAIENGLVGKVQVKFVVGTDGKLYDIEILRKVHPVVDQEVLRVIANSPKWEPAIQQGKYVKAMYGVVINFQLN
ncbi:MAG: hypothetical protein A2W99_07875 [Bacteroidetes bacterium GWF2_33_16]|nr:MAG: hypothetical protein A2X00_10930 [Bacteroidetes bacterium GWE2_32_14]OFY03694.1 MAG: hypothetical protein A2W99_07875 [Bacteroidetes bacterium GWF2_33_16]